VPPAVPVPGRFPAHQPEISFVGQGGAWIVWLSSSCAILAAVNLRSSS
jgi:hypothetical protein